MAARKRRADGKASNTTKLRIGEKLVMTGKRGRPRIVKADDPTDPIDKQGHTYESLKKVRRGLYHPKKMKDGFWMCGETRIPDCDELTALLFTFKHSIFPDEKEYLFWEIADILWNSDPDEPKFEKHKWSYEMIHHACREKFLSIGGAGGVGKSYVLAGWVLINWLCDPANTLVLITSTSLGAAMSRAWGCMQKLLEMVPGAPMKERYSTGAVPYWDGVHKPSGMAGLFLVSSDKSKDKNKVGKLIGKHAPRVFLLADELSDISENVLSAGTGNLTKNPFFQMIGLSNPCSRFDPFGIFSTPVGGWTSVNEMTDYSWRTKYQGQYIRLDCEQSPNIETDGSPEYYHDRFYEYLPTELSIEEDLSKYGDNPEEARKSRSYLRFNRAIFFDGSDDENIYSEGEFMRSGALDKTVIFRPTLLCGCDMSFSSGGDNTVMVFIEEGFDEHGQHVIQFKEMIYLYADETSNIGRNIQIADRIIAECKKRDIPPENFALDASAAGGTVFCEILQAQWHSNAFLQVQFGGAPSDRKIKNNSKVTGKDRYANRASELFFAGQTYLLGRQLYGIPDVIVNQFAKRAVLPPVKGPNGIRLQVEPKKLYKSRVGRSPDEQDAYLVAVELARVRHMFVPLDPVARDTKGRDMAKWLGTRRTHSSFAADKMGFVGNL